MAPITGFTMPLARRVPSFAAFMMRSSRGSVDSFSASSSMMVSAAKEPMGAPGARYAVDLGLLSTTSYASMSTLSMSYGENMHWAAAPTGEPG